MEQPASTRRRRRTLPTQAALGGGLGLGHEALNGRRHLRAVTGPVLDAIERDPQRLNGTGTFELEAPDQAEMARRREDVVGKGLPWLVAERDGGVLGYAYASRFRPRPAYRFCLEDSIYLAASAAHQGIGRLLLAELLA